MFSTVILPWLHYLAVLFMAGGVVAQLYLLKLKPTAELVSLLPRVDRVYGLGAVGVLITGLARAAHGGKGWDWYLHNGLFHGVLTVFVIAAALSLPATLRYLRWRKALNAGGALPAEADWRGARKFAHIGLAGMALIALMITAVAKGYGAAD